MRSLPCPVCGSLVQDHSAHIEQHVTWHEQTRTLGPKSGSYSSAMALRFGFRDMREAVALAAQDEAPTQKLPPITDTVRRRPPPPVVRELSERVELLRALVQELAEYDGPEE